MIATEQFWSLKISDLITIVVLIVTIFAIIYGPVKAVEIAREREDARDDEKRKRQIFAALMKTRRTYMHVDHVSALNLIQVEFLKNVEVIQAYKNYISNLSETVPPAGPALDRLVQRRSDLFFDLLYEIAKALSIDMDKRDLERLAYLPNGWVDEDGELRTFRRGLIEVLEGRRPFPVAPFVPAATPANSPFPPPPGN